MALLVQMPHPPFRYIFVTLYYSFLYAFYGSPEARNSQWFLMIALIALVKIKSVAEIQTMKIFEMRISHLYQLVHLLSSVFLSIGIHIDFSFDRMPFLLFRLLLFSMSVVRLHQYLFWQIQSRSEIIEFIERQTDTRRHDKLPYFLDHIRPSLE